MKKHLALMAFAAISSLGVSDALGQSASATATADLNIRTGPGPHYPSIGFIDAGGTALVEGCLQASKWCRVTYDGVSGWSYSDYLTADLSGQIVVLTERYPDVGLATITYEESGAAAGGAVAGAATGAVAGALIGGPIGAVVGGAAGATGGATVGAIIDPPVAARTYVTANPVAPIYLEGEVVIGAGIPDIIELRTIPNYEYRYVYVNGLPVFVDPGTRQIVYVLR